MNVDLVSDRVGLQGGYTIIMDSYSMLCLLATVCSKKEAVAPEKAERITNTDEADDSASSSSLRTGVTVVVFEFGMLSNCLGFGVCNITIISEKFTRNNLPPEVGRVREKNGKFYVEFASNVNHPQLNGSMFKMDGNFTLSDDLCDRVGLPHGYNIGSGNYPILQGPGNTKTVEF